MRSIFGVPLDSHVGSHGDERTQIWSSGGGVQSTAIAALICAGTLPRPDLAMIVDTTRERSTTWEYLEQVTRPALLAVGVDLVRVSAADYADTDLFEGEDRRLLIPVYTADTSERGGKLLNHCSTRWKRRVAQRWARAQGVQAAAVWYGISTDELRRVRLSREQWWEHTYPLVDLRMSRADCYAAVRRAGWPEPPKSSCWMCPHMRPEEWQEIKLTRPDEFRAAAALERQVQETQPNAYLTRAMTPLDGQDFEDLSMPLDLGGCDSGMCFV